MPYPSTTDPDYCAGSRQLIWGFDPKMQWFRCPKCSRLISAMGKTQRFFPHLANKKRARRRDAVQESLAAHGLNRKDF